MLYTVSVENNSIFNSCTVMCHITFWSAMDQIDDGGPIRSSRSWKVPIPRWHCRRCHSTAVVTCLWWHCRKHLNCAGHPCTSTTHAVTDRTEHLPMTVNDAVTGLCAYYTLHFIGIFVCALPAYKKVCCKMLCHVMLQSCTRFNLLASQHIESWLMLPVRGYLEWLTWKGNEQWLRTTRWTVTGGYCSPARPFPPHHGCDREEQEQSDRSC